MRLQTSPENSLILSDGNGGDENASIVREDVQEPDQEIAPSRIMNTSSTFIASLSRIFYELFESYKQALIMAPLLTKSISSATISILGEIFSSYLVCRAKKRKFSLSLNRLKAFGLYGFFIAGPILHWWYSLLDRTLTRMELSGYTSTICKLLLDRILFCPPFIIITIGFLQFFQHFSFTQSIATIKKSFGVVLHINEYVWTVANAINFHIVPVEYQVVLDNIISLGWNVLLSIHTP